MTDQPRTAASPLLPVLVLLALGVLIAGGAWAFPHVAAYMAEQDCIASYRSNCAAR